MVTASLQEQQGLLKVQMHRRDDRNAWPRLPLSCGLRHE